MTEVIEILPQLRQERAYFTWSISWVLMPWQHKEPGHQQPWYWLCWTESIRWYQATTKLMWLMNEAVQWDIVFLCSFVFTRAAILSHGNSELHDLHLCRKLSWFHYSDVITSTTASQVTSLTIVYWTVYSGADQKKILALRHWSLCGEFTSDPWLSPHRGPVTWQMFPFDDVIMLKKK